MTKRSICVYCGSREGEKATYKTAATALGAALANEGWRLVYGAGDIGLMGAVARSAQTAGGETFGVIPTHLLKKEVGKVDLTEFIVTENMHERKKVMFMNAQAIIVLPGGAGSLDEFFEVLTWAQLELHSKPIVLLNVENYWTPLIALMDHIIAEGFADPSLKTLFTVCTSVDEATDYLRGALS
ncbi:TIGR00730 family Rossman fold protein [Lentibacter algarum]|jgi:uncharacterized protein (TIGR00730 family)|uniref:LOG family protein n=1 Tax=Lentibacter algarum TaxID=576131 RepID=UPI0030FCDE42